MAESISATLPGTEGEPAVAASTARQFVTFRVAGEVFAVPLTQVNEIIRYPEVVRAPLGPTSLEGLGNLRGTVLPILSLRRMLGAEIVEHDDATRIVVLDDGGRPVGLVVDRMANVVTADADRIEPAGAIEATVGSDCLCGVIKSADSESMVMILDTRALIGRQFTTLTEHADGDAASRRGSALEARHARSDAADEIQLVSFTVAGQEYALPIEHVQEIVQIPERITDVPNSGPHVLGVMTLRDRLLPLVSLRRLFHLPDVELGEANKIVVVSPAAGMAVGLIMDSVREVLRVSRTLIDAVPEMLARSRDADDITSICRLSGGSRLVSILSAQRLLGSDALHRLHGGSGGDGGNETTANGAPPDECAVMDDEEQLVVFRVMNEEYAVPIASVQEIVRVPDELIRVPTTPDFIEGVVNLRGAVLPVVDQRRRFGLPAAERNDRQRIVVFAVSGVRTGFIVDSVSQVMRVPLHLIGPAPELSDQANRLIRRVVNLAAQKRIILMLEVDRLLDLGEVGAVAEAAAA